MLLQVCSLSNRPLSQVVAKRSKTAQHSAVCRSIFSNRSAHIPSRTLKRRKRPVTMTTRLSRAETPQADLSLLSKSLQRYYRFGTEAEALSDDREALRKLAAKFSKKYKIKSKSDHLLKARRFVQRLSSRECLKLLAKNCKLTGKPLSWSHVRHLVSVANAARRYQLLKDTVQNSWITTQLIDAIQVREGRTRHPKAGGRPPIKPKTVEEGMLRLQRLSEKWSALYQPPKKSDSAEKSSASLPAQVAPPALKQRIKDFFAVDGVAESASSALKAQVVGFLNALKDQVKEIGEVVAAIEEWKKRSDKNPRAKLKRSSTKPRRR